MITDLAGVGKTTTPIRSLRQSAVHHRGDIQRKGSKKQSRKGHYNESSNGTKTWGGLHPLIRWPAQFWLVNPLQPVSCSRPEIHFGCCFPALAGKEPLGHNRRDGGVDQVAVRVVAGPAYLVTGFVGHQAGGATSILDFRFWILDSRPSPAAYSGGPEKPSRRMRQKCTAMRMLATSGMKMQCRM